MSLKDNISLARKKMGFTQEQLAEECGVSRQAVTKWESGESEPTIAKLVNLSQVLKIDLTELVTGKKRGCESNERELERFDYRALSMATIGLTMDGYELDKTDKLSILLTLLEVIQTRYMNADGDIFEEYLLKNTTEEERVCYVKILMCEHIFAQDILQEYIDGKCEIDQAFKRLIEKVEKELFLLFEEKKKVVNVIDEKQITETFNKVQKCLLIMQNYEEFSEKKQREVTILINNIMNTLSEEDLIESVLRTYLKDIIEAWSERDKEKLEEIQEYLFQWKEYVLRRLHEPDFID